MVLYHVSTTYQLLFSIVHKLAYNRDEESELLMLETIRSVPERKSFLERLEKFAFFDKIRYVPERQFKLKKGMALDETSSESDILTVINNYCQAFEAWFGEDLKSFSNIYVASDQHALGVYLMKNRIPYNYMEDASGMLSEHERYRFIIRRNNLTNCIIADYLGGPGCNDMIVKKLCDLNNQRKGFYDSKAVDCSIYDTLKNVIPEKVPEILRFFGESGETVKSDKKICLFLTQDLNTLQNKDIELQELLMTLLVDYICPEYLLLIKPHPKDRWQNYRRIFPGSHILSRKTPSELIPFAVEGNIESALTISSTSIRGVNRFVNKSYYFTTEAETAPQRLNSMYVAAEILSRLGVEQGVELQNINNTQMNNFLDNVGIALSQDSDSNEVLIDGGVKRNDKIDFNAHKITVCLSLGEVISFSTNWDISNMYLIRAVYTPLEQSLMSQQEYLIILNLNSDKYKPKLNNAQYTRELKYSKVILGVSAEKIDERVRETLLQRLNTDLEWEDYHE